jgi:hypothetical protein
MNIFMLMNLCDSDDKLGNESSGNLELEKARVGRLLGIGKAASCWVCCEAKMCSVGPMNAESIKNQRQQIFTAGFLLPSWNRTRNAR